MMVHRLGRMSFANAFALQKELLKTESDHLLFVEHPPVYTCGRLHFKDIDDYLNRNELDGAEYDEFKSSVEKIDRGGNVTFHGNGQLVVYPIFDLRRSPFKKDLHWYLRQCENVIIDVLDNRYGLKSQYGFDCYHDEQYTGVWLKNDDYSSKQYKICAVGIGVSRWRTFHGLAFNINTDLNHFHKVTFVVFRDVVWWRRHKSVSISPPHHIPKYNKLCSRLSHAVSPRLGKL